MRTPRRVGYTELAETFGGFARDGEPIHLCVPPRSQYGQMNFTELALLCEIARCLNPRVIFEFGRFDGLSTLNLAVSAPQAKIFTLDLPDDHFDVSHSDTVTTTASTLLPSDEASYGRQAPLIARQRWRDAGVYSRIEEILLDSAVFDPDDKQFMELAEGVDLVFVDGNHSYEYITKDTDSALSMLKGRGVLIWHDYFRRTFPGVTAFLAELAEERDVCWIQSREDYLETGLCYCVL